MEGEDRTILRGVVARKLEESLAPQSHLAGTAIHLRQRRIVRVSAQGQGKRIRGGGGLKRPHEGRRGLHMSPRSKGHPA